MDDKVINKSLQKIGKGAGIIFFGTIIGMIFALIGKILIARNFSQSEYGIYSIGFVIINIFILLSTMGLKSGAARSIAFYRGKRDLSKVRGVIHSSIRITILTSVFFTLLLFIMAETISERIFQMNDLSLPLKIFALSIPFVVLINILVSIYRGFDRVNVRVYFQDIMLNIFFTSILIVIVALSMSFITIIWAYIISSALTLIFFYFFFINERSSIINMKKEKKVYPMGKELLMFSLPLLVFGALNMIWQWTDTLMLGYYKSPDVVGLYNAALPTSRFLSIVLTAVAFIYLPMASYLFSRNQINELKRTYAILTKWIFVAVFPIFLIIFLFPHVVLNILFGSSYTRAADALRILVAGIFIGNFFGPNGATLVALGKVKLVSLNSAIAAIANILLNIILIPRYGIVGAAYASAVSVIIIRSMQSIQIYRFYKIHPFTIKYIKPTAIAALLIGLVFILVKELTDTASTWMAFMLLIIILFIYIASFLITKCFDEEDLLILREIEKKLGIELKTIKKILKKCI